MISGAYTNRDYTFPSDDIDPKLKKEAKYCKEWCEAAYSLYVKDQSGIRYSSIEDMKMAKLYAEGRQPIEKYLDILCPKDKVTGERMSYMDISLDILSIIPKFRSIVIGKFMQRDHDIVANAIDEQSGAERQNMRLKLWTESQISKLLEPYKEALRVGLPEESIEGMIPESIDHLDMMQAAGAFKLKWEAGSEKLIKDAFQISNWQDVKQKLYEDIFDLGIASTRDYTCKLTGKAKTRYVDPSRLIVRHTKDHIYKDIDYAGEILDLTPNQIRIDAGESIPKEELEQIIRMYHGNSDLGLTFYDDIDEIYNKYGGVNIKVLELTWKTIDTDKVEKKIDVRGNTWYYNKDYNYKAKDGLGNRELLVGKKHMVYKCKWIVGSKYVYDYGVETDIIRKDKKNVELPYNIYKMTNKSLLASIIPLEDNIQLAWLKFQNAMSKASPSGIAVDVSALKNISNGSKQLKPLEILSIRRQTGDLLYKSTTHHSQVISPSSARPIIDIPGGAGAELDEYIKVIDFNINMVRQITGINELMDATAPNPNTLVGTAQMAEQATNNTLYNVYFAYKRLKEENAKHLISRIQNIISYVDYKPYEPVVGTSIVNMFKQGSPICHSDFGISISLKPTAAEKQSLLDKANFAFQQGMMRFSDLMYVEQEIIYGSIKMARIYLMWKEDKYRKEEEMKSQANVQAQSQAIQEQQANQANINAQLNEQQTNNEIKKMEARKVFDIDEYAAKHEMKMEQDDNESRNKMKQDLLK